MPEKLKNQKILALLVTIFLFSLVGSLFFSMSLKNKERTEILVEKVKQIRLNQEIAQQVEKINITDFSLLNLSSKSFLTLLVADNGSKKVLIQKKSDQVLPIASITKLMVAVVALENIDVETNITATLNYIGREESAFIIEAGKTYDTEDLLASALIASDNDSARLLSSAMGENNFIDKMNQKAQELEMFQTNYINITGLDPISTSTNFNTSTANDLAKLLIYIQKIHPEILKLTANSKYNFCDIKNYCKEITSTNKLLGGTAVKYKIIGGKTGSTDLAKKNLALLMKFSDNMLLLNIVLGSTDNFSDTLSLINKIEINN